MNNMEVVGISELAQDLEYSVWPSNAFERLTVRLPLMELRGSVADVETLRRSMRLPSLWSRLKERGIFVTQPLVPFALVTTGKAEGRETEVALIRFRPSVAFVFFSGAGVHGLVPGDKVTIARVDWRRGFLSTEASWFRKLFRPQPGLMWAQDWWRRGFAEDA